MDRLAISIHRWQQRVDAHSFAHTYGQSQINPAETLTILIFLHLSREDQGKTAP